MVPTNRRFPLMVVMILFVVMITAIAGGFMLPAASAGPETQGSCLIQVEVGGKGVVLVQQPNQPAMEVQAAEVLTGCENTVTLTARPAATWKFVGWSGNDTLNSKQSSITVSAPRTIRAEFAPREITYVPAGQPYYDRSGNLVDTVALYEPLWQAHDLNQAQPSQDNPPEISIWYGTPQPAGAPGIAQMWYDILGNVSDPDDDLTLLRYKLDDQPWVTMHVGGDGSEVDGRRLWNKGDFVVDLDFDDLKIGTNRITIRATDAEGNLDIETVFVDYTPVPTGWPLPANVEWPSAGENRSRILEVAQVVDGLWEPVAGGVRTSETGYDRLLNVGGIEWDSFEALVPITIHSFSEEGFGGIQAAPALGLLMHWQGHTDVPRICEQPKCGWLPIGMAAWYEWINKAGDAQFSMWVVHNQKELAPSDKELELGVPYLWKVQVNKNEGKNGTYRMKIWKQDEPEPPAWLMEKAGTDLSREEGSLLLLAHHVDVTFGDVKLREPNGDYQPPVLSNIVADAGQTQATITWQTSEAATSEVTYFDEPGNEQSVADDDLRNNHSIILKDLTPGKTYTFFVSSEDASLNEAISEQDTFNTTEELYTLTVLTANGGSVQIDEDKPGYSPGETVTLTAVPNPAHYFDRWIITVAGTDGSRRSRVNPLVLEITNDTTIQPIFLNQNVKFYVPLAISTD